MHRREFLQSMGLASAATLASVAAEPRSGPAESTSSETNTGSPPKTKTWLFWDLWHLDRRHNLRLCQGNPTWQPEATYVDDVDGLASWPTVCGVESSGRWRMFYTSKWKPYSLMVAESDDGLHFEPLARGDLVPEGEKLADHHVFTLPGGSAGGVYLDPVATDGYRFKAYAHQQREPVFQRALTDPKHRWHEIARREGAKRYMAEEIVLVSRDGLHWEVRPELEVKFRSARLYAFRGDFHFLAAQDRWMLGDSKPIATSQFDF